LGIFLTVAELSRVNWFYMAKPSCLGDLIDSMHIAELSAEWLDSRVGTVYFLAWLVAEMSTGVTE